MDSLTQIVLGAAVGESVLGKKVGNKAILWGAVAGTIPDLDVLSKYFVDEVSALEMHRGFSHSILFSVLFAPVFAFLVKRYERLFLSVFFIAMMAVFFLGQEAALGKSAAAAVLLALVFGAYKLKPNRAEVTTWDWTKLMFWALITHPLLDAHTAWGTQLFWPFEFRVAYKNIFVVDPMYTLPFLVFVVLAMVQRRESKKRKMYNTIGLVVSSLYMLLTIGFKGLSYFNFIDSLEEQQIEYSEVRTRPTPMNSILWSANVETEEAYYVGMYSLLDKGNDVDFIRFEKNHEALGEFAKEDKVQRLIKIAKGWYTVQQLNGDTIMYSDLRFGQIGVGKDKPFAFSYKMWHDDKGELVIQETPKTIEGGGEMISQLFTRLMGK
jgi:inner membrane protein